MGGGFPVDQCTSAQVQSFNEDARVGEKSGVGFGGLSWTPHPHVKFHSTPWPSLTRD